MNEIHVKTNWHVRDIVYDYQLPIEARKQFDYLDWDAFERGEDYGEFVQYRGEWYDLGDTEMTMDSGILRNSKWDRYAGESAWSAIVFRFVPLDYEEYGIIVGYATW